MDISEMLLMATDPLPPAEQAQPAPAPEKKAEPVKASA
jgi:hypothetical protein